MDSKSMIEDSHRARNTSLHGGSTARRTAASLAIVNARQCIRRSGAESGNPGNGKRKARLILNPNKKHEPETYEDLELDFSPLVFSAMERHLPPQLLHMPRVDKVKYMRSILHDYVPRGLRNKDQKQREYREKIMASYEPLHRELYTIDPLSFFVPTFLKAINDNTEHSFRSIMSEPTPGIFTFEMLQPHFCELLISEVENFEKWVNKTKFRVLRPNTMNKYGVVLDDFGLQTMLNMLMEGFICPLSKVFYAELGGSTLDSHHGYVVEYGLHRDVEMEFHVDDSEVTLNICLGRKFAGGEVYFRGMRCDEHLHTPSHSEEFFDYSHVPGQAVLHHGRHRHGSRATTAGHRVNLLLWCKSSIFRERQKYRKDFSSLCTTCNQEKKDKLKSAYDAAKMVLFQRRGQANA